MLNKTKVLKTTLLVCTVIFAILSIIPPIRWLGAYALRSISILSSANFCRESWEADNLWVRAFKCLKVSIIFLSLFALIFSIPSFILVVVGLITGLQFIDCLRHLTKKQWKPASIQAAMLIMDMLMLVALVTGLWQLIVVLSALSACLMLGIAVYLSFSALKNKSMPPIEGLYYFALSLLSIACAISTAELWTDEPAVAHFDVKNSSDHDIYVSNHNGLLIVLHPGESKHLDIPCSDLETVTRSTGPDSFEEVFVLMIANGPNAQGTHIAASSVDYISVLLNPAIPAKDIPTVPLSSGALVYSLEAEIDDTVNPLECSPIEVEMAVLSPSC